MSARKAGWRARLNAVLAAAEKQPFAWGDNDCGCFAASCVEAMTGEDPAAALRGTYDDALGAAKALMRTGARDLADFAAQRFAEVHPSQAQYGDLALLVGNETGWALGIFAGDTLRLVTPDGLGRPPRSRAQRAFRVG